ncbi:MAG: hypothetical protein A3F42_02850 [Gammaproteobacteria bacterium RIFCSPHIGHO2_12_FULL_37_34]|nr:MAG: hypothetical protein A3F42_02850 [Gammaproteobacteria bacterium RIFCSPHIGHO2_12_FULL_37_34]
MTRILFLCHRYMDVTRGGLAEFLHFLPVALKHYTLDSIIYTPPENKMIAHLMGPHMLPNNIPHYTGPLLKPRFFITKHALSPLLQLCKKEKINIVHAQGTYRAGFAAMHIYKQLGIPYVVTSHSDILPSNSKRMRAYRIYNRCRKILETAHFITHLSPLMAKASEEIYSAPTKSKMIHNGIDVDAWEDYLNLPEYDYLLAIGRLEPEKGFNILIDAYAQLVKQGMRTSLIIAGTGSIEHLLQQQAKDYGLTLITTCSNVSSLPKQSVIFTGYVKNPIKKRLFAHAKLILFATQAKQWMEPFGIVQLEAMAAGKALIASNIPIVHYLQSLGLQTKLVDSENITGWVNAISQLIENENLRYNMGKSNREAVKKFAWDDIAKEYAEIYQHLNAPDFKFR